MCSRGASLPLCLARHSGGIPPPPNHRDAHCPAPELLRMCVAAGKPIALSSDAHDPETIGHGYDEAVAMLRAAGVDRICVFDGRERREEPLG